MTEVGEQPLSELFDRLARDAADVEVADIADGRHFSRHGRLFAVLADQAVELRLRADIAEAARRTPSTTLSERGEEWLRFSPRELDQHALDRAEAWFLIAWRAAGER